MWLREELELVLEMVSEAPRWAVGAIVFMSLRQGAMAKK
jgi:hypothetical protein